MKIEENLKNLQNWFLKGYINEEEYDLKKKIYSTYNCWILVYQPTSIQVSNLF